VDALPPRLMADLDGPIAYREWEGAPGSTLVLVHGLGGMHLNWVTVAPSLAGLGRVLAPDLPGFGASPLSGRRATLMSLRRWLDRFLDELVGTPVFLIGSSMGGALSILESVLEPSRVSGVVLSGSALPHAAPSWRHPSLAAALAFYEVPFLGELAADERVRRLEPERLVRWGLRYTTADPAAIPEDVVRLHVEGVREHQRDPEGGKAFAEAVRSMLRLGRMRDVAERTLGNVRCPVLLIHGRQDRLVPAHDAEDALRRNPGWRGRILPGVGHAPQLETPGRWLAEVADWFPRSDASATT
jgi:pimeloyl-ACP methyl ester carboxylesterase